MNNNFAVIKKRSGGVFSKKVIHTNADNIDCLCITDRTQSIKKAKKSFGKKYFIAENNNDFSDKVTKFFCEYQKRADKLSCKILPKVIDGIIGTEDDPFFAEEIFVLANSQKALEIIDIIKDKCRLFTIVSDNCGDDELYDDFYFKYSVVVRRIGDLSGKDIKKAIVIRYDETGKIPIGAGTIIDFCTGEKLSPNHILLNKIYVSGDNIIPFEKIWGGKPSIMLFDLLGIKLPDDFSVNANITADKIFLLDTEQN